MYKEILVINWPRWQYSNFFILTEMDLTLLLLTYTSRVTYFIRYEAFPLIKPITRYHKPHLINFFFLIFILNILIKYKLFFHFPPLIQAIKFKARNFHWIINKIFEHLKWSKWLAFLTEYNILCIYCITMLASPLLVSLQNVHELYWLPILSQVIQHKFGIIIKKSF